MLYYHLAHRRPYLRAATYCSMTSERHDTSQRFNGSVRNGRHQTPNEESLINCCPSTRRFQTTHPFRGNSTNHNALCDVSKGVPNNRHSSSAYGTPPSLADVRYIAQPSAPRVHDSTAEQLDKWQLKHSSGTWNSTMTCSVKNMKPPSQWLLAAVVSRSLADDNGCSTNGVTVIDPLESREQHASAEPINLCVVQRWPNNDETNRAVNGTNLTIAPQWKHSRFVNVDSASTLSGSADRLMASTGGDSILRRVLMDAKTCSFRDDKAGVPGATVYVHQLMNNGQSSTMNLRSVVTPWNASTADTVAGDRTMVQHQSSRTYENVLSTDDFALGQRRNSSTDVVEVFRQTPPHISITDIQCSSTANQRYCQPSMDDCRRGQQMMMPKTGRPSVYRFDSVNSFPVSCTTTETFGLAACRTGYSSLDCNLKNSSDWKLQGQHQVSRDQLPSQEENTATNLSMTSSHSALCPGADQFAPSAVTNGNSRKAISQKSADRWPSINGRVDGVVVSASVRHSMSSQVNRWLDKILTFARDFRKFAGLSTTDHTTLLRRSRSRLLLLYMAEFNFRFSVENATTAQTEFMGNENDLASCVTVTTETARQIQLFIEQCRLMCINSDEYHCMRLVVLLHSGMLLNLSSNIVR